MEQPIAVSYNTFDDNNKICNRMTTVLPPKTFVFLHLDPSLILTVQGWSSTAVATSMNFREADSAYFSGQTLVSFWKVFSR